MPGWTTQAVDANQLMAQQYYQQSFDNRNFRNPSVMNNWLK